MCNGLCCKHHVPVALNAQASSKKKWQLASKAASRTPETASSDAAHPQQGTNGALHDDKASNALAVPESVPSDAAADPNGAETSNGAPSSIADNGPDDGAAALTACDAQLKQFAELCGESNGQKLKQFLQSVVQFEKVHSRSANPQQQGVNSEFWEPDAVQARALCKSHVLAALNFQHASPCMQLLVTWWLRPWTLSIMLDNNASMLLPFAWDAAGQRLGPSAMSHCCVCSKPMFVTFWLVLSGPAVIRQAA